MSSHKPYSDRVDRPRIAVYTAIARNYNLLLNPTYLDPTIDYICFTDELWWQRLSSNTIWRLRKLPSVTDDPRRSTRLVKLKPHDFLGDYDYSVFVDGSIDVTGDIRALLAEHDYPAMLAFPHSARSCAYEEGKLCIDKGKGDPASILNQLAHYSDQGFPKGHGLIESGVMIRRHADPLIQRIMNEWWAQLSTFSERDQISFPFAAWKNGYWPSLMEGQNVYDASPFFRFRKEAPHGARDLSAADRIQILFDRYIGWRFNR